MISRLSIPKALRDRIAVEAREAYPNECCGLIEGTCNGDGARTFAVHATRNLAAAPDRFEIDPAEHIRLARAAREKGRAIIGCYHSHPNGKGEPSGQDLASALDEDFLWLIAAIGGEGKAEVSAFIYRGGAFAPVRLAPARGAKV